MATPVSTVYGPLYIALQAAEGTAATTGFKKFHRASGTISTGKEAGKAEWLDGSRYSDAFDYVSSIEVTGQVTVHGSADAIGALAAWALGSDDVTGAGPYDHEIYPTPTIPFLTVVSTLGESPVNQLSLIHI